MSYNCLLKDHIPRHVNKIEAVYSMDKVDRQIPDTSQYAPDRNEFVLFQCFMYYYVTNALQ